MRRFGNTKRNVREVGVEALKVPGLGRGGVRVVEGAGTVWLTAALDEKQSQGSEPGRWWRHMLMKHGSNGSEYSGDEVADGGAGAVVGSGEEADGRGLLMHLECGGVVGGRFLGVVLEVPGGQEGVLGCDVVLYVGGGGGGFVVR